MNDVLLSPEGSRRRDELRERLVGAVVRRRRVRHTVRAVVVLLVGTVLGWSVWPDRGAPEDVPPIHAKGDSPAFGSDFEIVRNRADAVSRFAVDMDRPLSVEMLRTDEELLASLSAAGEPAGLMRIGSELVLIAELGE